MPVNIGVCLKKKIYFYTLQALFYFSNPNTLYIECKYDIMQ